MRASYAVLVASLFVACGDDGAREPSDEDSGVIMMLDAGHVPPAPMDGGLQPVDTPDSSFAWNLPRGFPRPVEPADNPMTVEKVALGRVLFYDERLSDNQTQSCASCHKQELAFTDGLATSIGSTGEVHPRGSMSLVNVAYAATLTWANPLHTELERQARVPIFGDNPIELGVKSIGDLEARLQAVPGYAPLFKAAFPDEAQPVNVTNLLRALASFERTLISGNSPFDRWNHGDEGAISESAKRGHTLFNTERLECFHCHGQFALTNQYVYAGQPFVEDPQFHQTGLYNLDGRGGYPEPNRGVFETSLDARDMGKFKAPTLRNIAVTAPYMHDGSIKTLPEVIDHYAKAGRAHSFRTDGFLVGFELTPSEVQDLIAFLESLTDEAFLEDPRFSDPGRVN